MARVNPTIAMEAILKLVPLDLNIEQEESKVAIRMTKLQLVRETHCCSGFLKCLNKIKACQVT